MTSSAHIRGQLKDAIAKGPQSKRDDQTKYDSMRHLGGALHCLEGELVRCSLRLYASNGSVFAAHSNYVELCLRIISQREPESGLNDVFPLYLRRRGCDHSCWTSAAIDY